VMTIPILEGLDGVQKMSKSLNNYVGIADSPDDMFGKIMSISDDLMWRYFELLSFRPMLEIEQWREDCRQGVNPRNYKVKLAQEIITRFHHVQAAEKALENFDARFQGLPPSTIENINLYITDNYCSISWVLREAGLTTSSSKAIQLINQYAVKIDNEKISDPKLTIPIGSSHIFQVGKRKFTQVSIHKIIKE